MYDIIIIGAGTAGLTAAIYACRANKSVLVLEKTAHGGQIINTHKIENYPAAPHISGPEFANKLYTQATELGAEIAFEKVKKIIPKKQLFEITTPENTYTAKTVIIATGSAERHLELEHEDSLVGHGVSYCATCDGNFFKGKDVAVNGGGNTAFWDALYLADLAKTVTIIHRRNTFRADAALVKKVKAKKNVKFITGVSVTALVPEKGKLKSIQLSSTKTLNVAGLFVAIGRAPDTAAFEGLVELDDEDYIKSDETCTTSKPGIFVAGDNRKKPLHQLVTAAADGAVAATAAIKYLNQERTK
ncbi:FAD-dependent oxidoreductase [Candidatus Saccharibacteria bacterium]|nr:FAD-dependent oxidoreductase [Candidatus Saccharibacteria bacterium]